MKIKSQSKIFYKSYGNGIKIFGYASIFHLKDRDGDIVLPGAFTTSLKLNCKVKLLWQHKQDHPIGTITKIFEDTKGLYVEGLIFNNISHTASARKMLLEGVVDSFSIGYTIAEHFYNHDTRYLKQLNLFEVSIVTFPANVWAKLKIAM